MNIDLMDYFAAKAMQSLLSDETIREVADEQEVNFLRVVATMSYEMAICMMAERKQLMEGVERDSIQ